MENRLYSSSAGSTWSTSRMGVDVDVLEPKRLVRNRFGDHHVHDGVEDYSVFVNRNGNHTRHWCLFEKSQTALKSRRGIAQPASSVV